MAQAAGRLARQIPDRLNHVVLAHQRLPRHSVGHLRGLWRLDDAVDDQQLHLHAVAPVLQRCGVYEGAERRLARRDETTLGRRPPGWRARHLYECPAALGERTRARREEQDP